GQRPQGRWRGPAADGATSAQLVPSSSPARASDSQWAPRYARDSAMARAKDPAAKPHPIRRLPGGAKAMTAASPVTEAATAWPEGNDAAVVATSEPGGLARS